MSAPLIVILMGSRADEAHARKVAEAAALGIESVLRVGSAHKTPEHVLALLRELRRRPAPAGIRHHCRALQCALRLCRRLRERAGDRLPAAVQAAYRAVENIHFDGRQYRRDIAARAFKAAPSAYAAAGVNIDAGNRAVTLMSQAVRSTYTPAVLAGIGAFGGLFDAAALGSLHEPVLVASTDGVGTKVKLAAQLGRYGSIGADLVNHCINDILVQGARPLFFLDYFASAQIDPEIVAAVVGGLAAACRESGVALLGGETAEMPGVYHPGEFDLAGSIVGALERERRLPRAALQPSDLLIGLRSSGPHTNGYSLIRRVFAAADLNAPRPELGGSSLGDALLAPHRSYLNLLIGLIEQSDSPILALAHLTGGGFIENIPRVLPQGLGARIRRRRWRLPPSTLPRRSGAASASARWSRANRPI